MNEIKVAENKTLKLTNVVARRIAPEELGNMMVALTQLQNFIKSHNAQPIGPLVQALKIGPAPEHAPELYLMQQATQLITQTEQLIQQAIDHLLQDRTSFLIAHRLSTIRKADMILVVRDGVISEEGTHQELLASNKIYAEVFHSQQKGVA